MLSLSFVPTSVFLLACVVGSSAVAVEPAPLSIAKAQALAIDRSRQLASHDFAAQSARHMAVAAAQLPDPVVKLAIENLPVSGADRFSLSSEPMTMRRIALMQELTGADKRQLRASRYQLDANSALAEKAVTRAALERDAAIAWLNAYYLEAMQALVAEQLAKARNEVAAADSAYRSGASSQTEVLDVRVTLALLEDRASELARQLANARVMLARWVGPPGAAAPLLPKPEIWQIRFDPARLDASIAQHPALVLLASRQALAETDVHLAQANQKADWAVELAYSQRGNAFGDMVSVGVSIPLQWNRARRQNRELAATLATALQTRAETDETRLAVLAEAQQLLTEWASNRARLARFTTEIIPLASSRSAASMAAYRGARTGLAELLAAQRAEVEARAEALQLESDSAVVWAQLNFLLPAASIDKDAP